MKPGMGVALRIVTGVAFAFAVAAAAGCGKPGVDEPDSAASGLAPAQDRAAASAAPADLAASSSRDELVAEKMAAEPAPVAVSAGPANVIASANLLNNGSFDQGPASEGEIPHWRMQERMVAGLDDGAYDGPSALRVELAGNQNFGAPQTVEAAEAGPYLLRGYIKTDGIEGGARLEVQDAEGGYKSFIAFTDSVEGTQDWTQVSKIVTVPAHVKSLAVYLRRPAEEGASETPGTVWFDRCELFRLAPPAGAGLVRNGSFEWGENGMSWWQNVPEGATVVQADDAVEGEKSLHVSLPNGQNLGIAQGVGVTAGKRYVVTGYVKCENVTGKARLEVVDVNAGWTSFIACSDAISGTQNWTPLTLVFQAPDHVAGVNVLLRCVADESETEGTGTAGFDHYEMYELAG